MNEKEQKVFETLKSMEIEYERVEHPEVHTCEEADAYIEGIEGVRTKSLFLRGKKSGKYYLVILDDMKRLSIKEFEQSISEKSLSLASDERLMEKMGLLPGHVSLFGLLNDDRSVIVYLDEEMFASARVSFLPNWNTSTIFLSVDDMIKFLKHTGNEYHIVKL